jgi:KDO2-lipid IV(A) lauroyltransferase
MSLWLLFAVFRGLPLDLASALGGWLARKIGRFLRWNRIAEANLRLIFPDKNEQEIRQFLQDMWDNLGRNLAEYPWLNTPQLAKRVRLTPESDALMRRLSSHHAERKTGLIFAAGHFGNWEIAPLVAHLYGIPMTLIYRRVNNPLVEKIIYNLRIQHCDGLFQKGRRGAAEVLRTLKNGKVLGMLVDQKMNEGVSLPFLGHPAMTAPAVADLTLKFAVPLVLARVTRQGGVHFEVELLEVPIPEGTTSTDLMLKIHQFLEHSILENPAQWLWVHQRWGKVKL